MKFNSALLMLLCFFTSYAGIGNSTLQKKDPYNESIFSTLPISIRNRIAYFCYCNELKERARKKNDYKVYSIFFKKRSPEPFDYMYLIKDRFTEQQLSENYPIKKYIKSEKKLIDCPKIILVSLVGWWIDVGRTKLISAQVSSIKEQRDLCIDYGRYKKADIIPVEEVLKDFKVTMSRVRAATVSRDRKRLFVVARKSIEDLTLYGMKKTKDEKQKEEWHLESIKPCPLLINDSYIDSMYFGEFKSMAYCIKMA
ncbi:MAG: hypothetical protein AB7R69_03430 [Candidatus Babeliales bacterium]